MSKKFKVQYNYNDESNFMIKLSNTSKSFGKKKVLKDINLEIKKGERISILGHNGSGKSTLSKIISGIQTPTSGQIVYSTFKNKNDLGKKTGIQFQKIKYPEGYKVKEVINFFNGTIEKSERYTKKEINELIKIFGIDKILSSQLVSLSGGQQQRINLFLTYIRKPELLMLDELSTGLDISVYKRITELFLKYIEDNNVTVIMVSHNISEIKEFTDISYFLNEGTISKSISSKDLTHEIFLENIKRRQEENSIEEQEISFGNVSKDKGDNFVIRTKDRFNSSTKSFLKSYEKFEKKILKEKRVVELFEKKKNTQNSLSDIYENINDDVKKTKEEKKKIASKRKDFLSKQIKIDKKINREILKIEYYFKLFIKKIKRDKFNGEDVQELQNKVNDFYLKEKFDNYFTIKNFKHKQEKIIISNLTKYFQLKRVLSGINFEIKKGERIAITGANGSGKTTFTEILSTTMDKTFGNIEYYFGKDKKEIKNKIGMQFQESSFPSDLKIREIIDLFYKISKWKISRKELNYLIELFKIEHLLEEKGGYLSGGERQKINVLISLIKSPSLLILDEISTGLDIESIEEINEYIRKFLDHTNSTLVLISHNPEEVKRLTKTLYVLDKGELIEKIDISSKSVDEVRKIFIDIYDNDYEKREEKDENLWELVNDEIIDEKKQAEQAESKRKIELKQKLNINMILSFSTKDMLFRLLKNRGIEYKTSFKKSELISMLLEKIKLMSDFSNDEIQLLIKLHSNTDEIVELENLSREKLEENLLRKFDV